MFRPFLNKESCDHGYFPAINDTILLVTLIIDRFIARIFNALDVPSYFNIQSESRSICVHFIHFYNLNFPICKTVQEAPTLPIRAL